MLKNYINIAIRNLLKYRAFSFINIFGLALAMAICMGIIMLVADQMMYDRFNTNRDRIYRVTATKIGSDGVENSGNEYATTALPVRNELIENYTGIEKAVRITRGFGNGWIEFDQDLNIPLYGYYADPEVLDLFQYELEHGDSKTALVEPYSVVLTHEAARKLFKMDNPVGETIKVGDLGVYKVTGVLKKTDRKSHIVFEAFASISTLKSLENLDVWGAHNRPSELENWNNIYSGWVYLLLEKGKTPIDIQQHFDQIYEKQYAGITNPDLNKVKFHLQELMSITPGNFMNNPIGPFLPWMFIYFFIGLAAVVLITSCFNFTNLSIARSLSRAREIGVRKVSGASRSHIFTQFITESVLVALFSMVLAFAFLILIKPLMLELTMAKLLKWDLQANNVVYIIFLFFAVGVGILAGFFPAVVLSGFQPVKVLKNLGNMKLFSRMGLRKTLLVSQFTMSLIFILTVIITYNQLNLFLHADHGFSMENKIIVPLNNTSSQALKTELMKYSNITNVTVASHIPASGTSYSDGFKKSLDEKEWTDVYYFSVDEDYLKSIDVPLIAGRYFTPEAGESNKNFIVINEKAVETFQFGSPGEALGQVVIHQPDSSLKEVIGVVKDYNHSLLLQKLEPMALLYIPKQHGLLQVSYSGDYNKGAETVEKAWAAVNPTLKMTYKDFGAEIRLFYNMIFGDLVNILSVISILAVVISCLGMLGMATYATETRIKEISIRKILGSTNGSLVYMLSKGFLAILAIAILIAVPAAWFLNNLWLELIAYHITINVGMVLLGIFILIVFGIITVGSQTWRATFVNPVENLKSE